MTNGFAPVPSHLRRRLWYAVAGGALFMTTACAEGAQRPDDDAWHQSISALSLGPGGWVQMLNFIAFGVIVLSTVTVWRRILAAGTGATAVPFLTALTGVSLLGDGRDLGRAEPALRPRNISALMAPRAAIPSTGGVSPTLGAMRIVYSGNSRPLIAETHTKASR